ncbi:Asp-tRNA(Asn)/Glu-tRNA(Gln) amidotransferase subunit GatC [Fundidesulfovibrio agrisoli]|uniref:Asp-tRNA(Asn)/Glu-tRNA(Gln) amidotransferase subunit GatC n=1 Tax=Fundidesulfovibrio agrisoli TaxID=2922717 RepID=UPI001FACC325|nr:Asp-tRNA(Asn)/Glu-tRNA(Gln) amidotransferase subunit GatC [Fundidesulfovibrio agrisoli]
MKFTPQQAAKVAALARLRLPEEKLERIASQIGDILNYMEALEACDTAGVEPLYSPVEHPTPLRADVAEKTFQRSDILSGAPETDGTYFIVPKIVAG